MRRPGVVCSTLALLAVGVAGCAGAGEPPSDTGRPRVTATVATGLAVPWGIAFLPDGSAVVTERDSRRVLRLAPRGESVEVTEIGLVEEAAPEVEAGLLGVAVSPEFASDHTLFLYATTARDNTVFKVALVGDHLGTPTPILTGIPKGVIHDGGRLAFGPDGFLYVSTGETGDPTLAQDPESLAGKILRITPDGDPAPGNPDEGSPVWSLGHRNVQGLAFDASGQLWASEFGDQTFDELNRVTRGGNYGWPDVEGRGGEPEYVDPVLTWSTEDASPSGLAFAHGALWMAALRGQRLWQIPLDGDTPGAPVGLFTGDYGRLRTVVSTPTGDLWVATSNRDGRGDPADLDDRILLVSPG
ncbi:PQQ-dependent sugar dehydrogenase [Nocardioides sp.]|uniref:PQQ-dependent sugar dehydrogenase n=1 Tax=Nocardioides sp. TaxID=35761 RepID=UPI00286EA5CB|nr:PQQ-dependent sugar dehydrogenase [Nocardioides sp.]